jgi:hypothetical protein
MSDYQPNIRDDLRLTAEMFRKSSTGLGSEPITEPLFWAADSELRAILNGEDTTSLLAKKVEAFLMFLSPGSQYL